MEVSSPFRLLFKTVEKEVFPLRVRYVFQCEISDPSDRILANGLGAASSSEPRYRSARPRGVEYLIVESAQRRAQDAAIRSLSAGRPGNWKFSAEFATAVREALEGESVSHDRPPKPTKADSPTDKELLEARKKFAAFLDHAGLSDEEVGMYAAADPDVPDNIDDWIPQHFQTAGHRLQKFGQEAIDRARAAAGEHGNIESRNGDSPAPGSPPPETEEEEEESPEEKHARMKMECSLILEGRGLSLMQFVSDLFQKKPYDLSSEEVEELNKACQEMVQPA